MESKYYEPSLIWALFTNIHEVRGDTVIKIFLAGGTSGSHFVLRRSKIYWKQNPAQSYIVKCNNNTLAENSENLGEVIAENLHHRGETLLLGKTYEAFIDFLTK